MGLPSAGTIVLVRFPFSDLSNSKLRPAIVLADAQRGDLVLCQITSQPYTDPIAVEISNTDLSTGSFRKNSYARPAKLFTANLAIITKQIGELNPAKHEQIVDAIVELLKPTVP